MMMGAITKGRRQKAGQVEWATVMDVSQQTVARAGRGGRYPLCRGNNVEAQATAMMYNAEQGIGIDMVGGWGWKCLSQCLSCA